MVCWDRFKRGKAKDEISNSDKQLHPNNKLNQQESHLGYTKHQVSKTMANFWPRYGLREKWSNWWCRACKWPSRWLQDQFLMSKQVLNPNFIFDSDKLTTRELKTTRNFYFQSILSTVQDLKVCPIFTVMQVWLFLIMFHSWLLWLMNWS